MKRIFLPFATFILRISRGAFLCEAHTVVINHLGTKRNMARKIDGCGTILSSWQTLIVNFEPVGGGDHRPVAPGRRFRI
jgi:hypothetical protein